MRKNTPKRSCSILPKWKKGVKTAAHMYHPSHREYPPPPGGVSYTVNLMHIGPKFGKIQPIQCALRNKIARVCFSIIFFFAFWTKHIFRIIATAAWIIKAIINLYSDYAVFKFDGSMLKSCRFTRLQECLVAIVCHFGLHTGHQVAHLIYA